MLKLLKVAGFSQGKSSSTQLKIADIVNNFEDRLAKSQELKDECVLQISKLMKDRGYSVAQAMKYFDTDNSGTLEREEVESFVKSLLVGIHNDEEEEYD